MNHEEAMDQLQRDTEDRMAFLAGRILDPDPAERAYASRWLDTLWALWEAHHEHLA